MSVLVVGGWLAFGSTGNDGEQPATVDEAISAPAEPTAAGEGVPSSASSPPTAAASAPDDLGSTDSDEASGEADTGAAAPVGSADAPTTTTTEPPPPDIPMGPISEETPSDTCQDIQERLRAYRDVAAAEPMSSLLFLQLALEEFEHQVDFYAMGADWGIAMLEELVVVRRDWATAYAAHQAEDDAEAEARFESALDHLDAATAVPCP